MQRDGNLRPLFRSNLPDFFWTSVESHVTGRGIPDSHFIKSGAAGWVEFKKVRGRSVGIRPEQGAWLHRYSRAGGRCFVAVRLDDGLAVFSGADAVELRRSGLTAAEALGRWDGNPRSWDWGAVRAILTRPSA